MTNRYTIGHPEEWWNPDDWVYEDEEDDGSRTDMLIKQAKEERYFDEL